MRTILCLLLLLIAAGPVASYPTSSNLIPTADMLEPGNLRVEGENDGAPRPFGGESENYLLLQYGATPRLEIGLDVYGVSDTNDLLLNAKWLAIGEARRRPAVAVGVLEYGSGFDPVSYVVGTKDLGRGLRLHLGGATAAGDRALLLGLEQQITPRDYLLADWSSWRQGYTSVGLYHEFGAGLALNVAYAWSRDGEELDAIVVNLAWTHALSL